MKPFSIAGIQMKVFDVNNVETMKHKIEVLMYTYPWVQMVVFSELSTFGYSTKYAQPFPNKIEDEFCKIAAKHRIWLLPGSMFEKAADGIYNTASVINPDGVVVGRYRKMFPFYPYEAGVKAGQEFFVFDVDDVGKFGVSICYDMWFPETTRTLAVMGAEVILHPTLTGTMDREIELSIVRASSAINQCFIFDINGLESGGNGRSIICGPDGRILYQADSGEEMMPLEINLELVKRSRENGVLKLGQPLKSFRDRAVDFSIYNKNQKFPYLDSLGELSKPAKIKKNDNQGLIDPAPSAELPVQ